MNSYLPRIQMKTCVTQPNDCYISLPTAGTAYTFHRAHVYFLVHSSSFALQVPTPLRFRRSGWGRPVRGQVRGPAAPAPHLHSREGGWGSAIEGIGH
jgi:hypothetical protein